MLESLSVVVDNNHPIPPGLIYYPQYLQAAGYDTAFIGKWHMGDTGDNPQPGFDHWVSFKGQGSYLPSTDGLNVDGRRVPQKGYITDELTDYAIDWIGKRDGKKPWMLHLAHKAVHSEFIPAERHKGRYANETFRYPDNMRKNVAGRPMWVENQRNSWRGVDYAYHGNLDIADYYKRYMETLLAVDEGLGAFSTCSNNAANWMTR
nr:sulfatase-like hydrolase/transferase [Sphingomonas sp. CFBP 13720]